MRLEKYILEGDTKADLDTFLKETKQYRDEMRGSRLWRAHNHRVISVQKFSARSNRRPKDTPQEVHEFLDKFFQTNFGWKARSQGVFAASTPNGIDIFGKYTDLIYPCNGYKFVYSKTIQDLTNWLEEGGYIDSVNADKWESINFDDTVVRVQLLKKLQGMYIDKNLRGATGLNTEVMLHCPNGYYMLSGDFFRINYDAIEGDYR